MSGYKPKMWDKYEIDAKERKARVDAAPINQDYVDWITKMSKLSSDKVAEIAQLKYDRSEAILDIKRKYAKLIQGVIAKHKEGE